MLVGDLLAEVPGPSPDGGERRLAICVAGPRPAAREVSTLAAHARSQASAKGYFALLYTPGKFPQATRDRLDHLVNLVTANLSTVGADASPMAARTTVWRLLSNLEILMPRVEVPDETDWEELLNQLEGWAREPTLDAAAALRARLESLAASYAPVAADVDLTMLRRDAHEALNADPSRATWPRGDRPGGREDRFGQADRAAGWAQYLRDRDPELAVAVASAAVGELAPSPCAVLTLWSLTTAARLRRLPIGHVAGVTSVVQLPDSHQLRTIDGAGVVCTWERSGGLASVAYLPGRDVGGSALLSADGQHAIIAEPEGRTALWRLADEVLLGRRPSRLTNDLHTFSWAANGHFAGQFDVSTVNVHSVAPDGPKLVATLDVGFASATAWSPDSEHLAVATDHEVIVVDLGATTQTVRTLRVASESATLCWSPDGSRLAVLTPAKSVLKSLRTAKRLLRIYDVAVDGALLTQWKITAADALAWSPDSAMVAYVVPDHGKDDRLVLRDVCTGEITRRTRTPRMTGAVWWPADDRIVTGTFAGGSLVWDLAKDKTRQLAKGPIRAISWAPNLIRAAVSGPGTRPRIVGSDPTKTIRLQGGNAIDIQWSPAGNLVAGTDRHTIHLWDPSTGRRIGALSNGDLPVGSLAWSPDGSRLAVASYDFFGVRPSLITVWDVTARRPLATIDGAGPLDWSPDNQLLAGTDDGTVTGWDPRTGQEIRAWRTDQKRIRSLRWSPDSSRLAWPVDNRMDIARRDDGAITRCVGHAEPIDTACWSPDSRYLATVAGSSLTIWDAERGTPMGVLALPRTPILVGLCWAAEITGTLSDGSVLAWRLPADLWSPLEATEPCSRQLSDDERQRFGLPRQSPAGT